METLQFLIPIITASLVLIMFGMGTSLTWADFRRIGEQPRPILLGLFNQLLLLPLLGVAFVAWVPLSVPLAVGVVIVVACPGGSLSNLISHLGRLDTALSVSLTAISTCVAALSLPFWLRLGLSFLGESEEVPHIPLGKTILQVVLTTVLPVFVGLLFARHFPALAKRIDRWVRIFAISFLIVVVSGALFKDPSGIVNNWNTILPMALLFNAITLGVGYGTAYLLGLSCWRARTIMIETGIQNIPLALTITTVVLQSMAMAILPTLYGVAMMVSGVIFLLATRKSRYQP